MSIFLSWGLGLVEKGHYLIRCDQPHKPEFLNPKENRGPGGHRSRRFLHWIRVHFPDSRNAGLVSIHQFIQISSKRN